MANVKLIFRKILLFGWMLNPLILLGQTKGNLPTKTAENFEFGFSRSDMMTLGSYYYPEQWPEKYWERDIKRMADLGFEFTHFGEFAWSNIEPSEGEFDFKWLDKAITLADKYKLKVILCTSTPTPPAWLSEKHPEILMTNSEGRVIQHGARQHASWSSSVYRDYVNKMVDALGKHYGNDDRIWGWQLDNEPSHYGQQDFSLAAQKNFQSWLKNKYNNIDDLNRIWGTSFWSLRYDKFEQIRIPNPKELVQQPNPHAMLDFKRFSASEVNEFLKNQAVILRKHIRPKQWITTNLMPEHGDVDPSYITSLDFLTYTKYLVAGYDNGYGELGYRMGSASSIGFSNDLFRSFNGVTGVMELQPGQVNWGVINPQPLPGAVRMWVWHAFAGGNKFICNYRFKQPLTGGEQYHNGIIRPDGVTLSSGGKEYETVISEMKLLRKLYSEKTQIPSIYKDRQAAILYSVDSRWEMNNQPQTNQWDYMGHLKKYYNTLKSFGAPVDIITEEKDFSKYRVLVAPAYQLLDSVLVKRWEEYVRNGGHLVLTCRTGQKDRNGKLWEAEWAAPINNLIGSKIPFFDLIPDTENGFISIDSKNYSWNNWGDVLEPYPNTTVWATYSNQFYKGKASVTNKKIGKGSVTYIGSESNNGLLENTILGKVFSQTSIPIANYPEGVMVDWRDGFWVGVNYSSKPYLMPVKSTSTIIIGDKTIPPAGVLIWKD